MCGPLVALAGIRLRERRAAEVAWGESGMGDAPERPRSPSTAAGSVAAVAGTLVYHSARILVYTALGAAMGAAGSFLGAGGAMATATAIVSLVLGASVVTVGLGYMGLLPAVAHERGDRWWTGAASWALRRPGLSAAGILGAFNGLLPCGLVYGALLVAAGMGSPAGGALCMLVFGLATVPALAVIQTGAGVLLRPSRRIWFARAAGVLVVIIGIQLLLRGLAVMGVIPSAQVGGLMLW
jgi:sulfite exporter TauE/SafE